jgi:hypothetical protein
MLHWFSRVFWVVASREISGVFEKGSSPGLTNCQMFAREADDPSACEDARPANSFAQHNSRCEGRFVSVFHAPYHETGFKGLADVAVPVFFTTKSPWDNQNKGRGTGSDEISLHPSLKLHSRCKWSSKCIDLEIAALEANIHTDIPGSIHCATISWRLESQVAPLVKSRG